MPNIQVTVSPHKALYPSYCGVTPPVQPSRRLHGLGITVAPRKKEEHHVIG